MNETIWKFELKADAYTDISMPKGAHVLCVQEQGGVPCIWAIVNPSAEKENRRFRVYGTGYPLEIQWNESDYVGTFQIAGGALVFHVFEV